MGEYDAWLNRPVETTMRLDPWPAQALSATLGASAGTRPDDGGDLPCLWHWLYFLETADRDQIGPDGHPHRGGFLPPIPHPRRMFAGGRTTVHRPLRLGTEASLTQTVTAIQPKGQGPQGMWLVTVGYDYRQSGVDCVREERDFIYLAGLAAPVPTSGARSEDQPAPPPTPWREEVLPDPVLLMRFSALTFNSHRIHYDRDYAVDQEGYAERVVHGPLTAILLAELARREGGRPVAQFSFRAKSPLLVNQPVVLAGTPEGAEIDLTAYGPGGRVAMSARAVLG